MPIDIGDTPTGTPPTTGEKLQIRTAIGLGQTDAPTFLAQTLTGQSLTGTQATSLVDLAATWNTSGNPSLIYGRVVNTNSGTTANLIDLGTFAGGSLFKVDKTGAVSGTANITGFGSNQLFINTPTTVGDILAIAPNSSNTNFIAELSVQNKIICNSALQFGWGSQGLNAGNGVSLRTSLDTILVRDGAPGILAQRNGTAAQAFRVYNSTDATPATNFDRASFGFTSNVLRIGTEHGGTYTTARPIDFVTGGVVRMSIAATGGVTVTGPINTTSVSAIQAGGNVIVGTGGSGRGVIFGGGTKSAIFGDTDGVLLLTNNAGTSFTRLEFGAANLGISRGTGSPEGVVTALVGSLYIRTDGGAATTLYVKESGTGNTGWVAK